MLLFIFYFIFRQTKESNWVIFTPDISNFALMWLKNTDFNNAS